MLIRDRLCNAALECHRRMQSRTQSRYAFTHALRTWAQCSLWALCTSEFPRICCSRAAHYRSAFGSLFQQRHACVFGRCANAAWHCGVVSCSETNQCDLDMRRNHTRGKKRTRKQTNNSYTYSLRQHYI